MQVAISALIVCKNEAQNIERCLSSLDWLEEIILVDSGSTDDTLELARKYPNVKIYETDWKGYSETKRWALQYTSYSWVLWIDADEQITASLKNEICAWFSQKPPSGYVAFQIPRKTYFINDWVKYCGWYPGYVTRLFNKNYCDFNHKALHEGVEIVGGKTGKLQSDMLHFSYTTVYQYFEKMNRYGKDGARALIQKGRRFSVLMLVFAPLVAFLKFYILKRGFLEGTKGLIICIGSGFSTFIKYVNLFYLEREA